MEEPRDEDLYITVMIVASVEVNISRGAVTVNACHRGGGPKTIIAKFAKRRYDDITPLRANLLKVLLQREDVKTKVTICTITMNFQYFI